MRPLAIFCCLLFATLSAFSQSAPSSYSPGKQTTICNPLNLSYRFSLDSPSRREAADPCVVLFRDKYYLFASKSGGYWESDDLIDWRFITSPDLPFEDYAPAAMVRRDTVYFMASSHAGRNEIYKTADPASGHWQVANPDFPIRMVDPDLFADEDGRIYFYYGCSDKEPIRAVELDTLTLNPVGQPVECFNSHMEDHGWERPGDYNDRQSRPWVEGSWMTKHNGTYYLQYAAPGTQFKSYADGLYTATSPLGPFSLAANNPFSYKPEGFIAGAGHGCTFRDKFGNYWYIGTMTISVKHMFERRLGLFPVFLGAGAMPYTYTAFGDFPFVVPQKKLSGPAEWQTPWMLLSWQKPVTVSSALPGFDKYQAVNEDIRNYWSAVTGGKSEWISIDLEKTCTVNAVQLNFAEQSVSLLGRTDAAYYQYLLEYSTDNKHWKKLADKSNSRADLPHDYIELSTPIHARYLRLQNRHMPDGLFALSGFRVFGKAPDNLPAPVRELAVKRSATDPCVVHLSWKKSPGATGYLVHYGTAPDRLYQHYQVLGADTLTIRSLNGRQPYYFSVDAFNEQGVKKGEKIVEAEIPGQDSYGLR